MTIQDVTRLIAMCKARYPRANWSPDEMLTIQMWHDALGDLPGEAVLTTAREMMRRSEFPPDPAEIRSRLFAQSGLLPEPDQAWGMVVDQVKGRRDPGTTPMTIKQCIKDIGGIFMLRQSEHPERDRDRFVKAYRARRKEAMVDAETVGMLSTSALGSGG